jgi:hypothetical protein
MRCRVLLISVGCSRSKRRESKRAEVAAERGQLQNISREIKMAGLGPRPPRSGSGLGRSIGPESSMMSPGVSDPHRELFDACRAGDLVRVKRLVTSHTVNARDTAGRKSTPLHFAAGE